MQIKRACEPEFEDSLEDPILGLDGAIEIQVKGMPTKWLSYTSMPAQVIIFRDAIRELHEQVKARVEKRNSVALLD